MKVELRLSHAEGDLSRNRALPGAAGSTGIRDQVLGEAGGPNRGESSARANNSRREPIGSRRDRLFLRIWGSAGLLCLPAICLWVTAASAQEIGSEKAWIAPAVQAEKKNPVAVNESSLGAGQKIYLRTCATCHGKTGNGDGPDAVDLGLHPAKFSDPKLREETDGALFWKITAGKKPMPDYGRRRSPTDRWNVINYLRTLARR
jgi:mono/diheme cytochrome c family protein